MYYAVGLIFLGIVSVFVYLLNFGSLHDKD